MNVETEKFYLCALIKPFGYKWSPLFYHCNKTEHCYKEAAELLKEKEARLQGYDDTIKYEIVSSRDISYSSSYTYTLYNWLLSRNYYNNREVVWGN